MTPAEVFQRFYVFFQGTDVLIASVPSLNILYGV